jgi:hypothetical protein
VLCYIIERLLLCYKSAGQTDWSFLFIITWSLSRSQQVAWPAACTCWNAEGDIRIWVGKSENWFACCTTKRHRTAVWGGLAIVLLQDWSRKSYHGLRFQFCLLSCGIHEMQLTTHHSLISPWPGKV